MTHNKILAAAVVAALSIGGGMAQAATFTAIAPTTAINDDGVIARGNIDAGIAYELFDPTAKTPPEGFATLPKAATCTGVDTAAALDPADAEVCFAVAYKFGQTTLTIIKDFTVKFTLKNAQFIDNKLPQLVVYTAAGGEHDVQISSSGSLPDPITSFSQTVSAGDTEILADADANYLLLKEFQIEVVEKDYAVSGQQAELTIEITSAQAGINDSQTIILAKTVAGYSDSEISPNPATEISEIDIKAMATAFTPGSVDNTGLAYLGSLKYNKSATPTGMVMDSTTTWVDNLGSKSARITNLPSLPEGATVFIDNDSKECKSADTDIQKATLSLDDAEAVWDPFVLNNPTHFCIKLPDSNTSVIDENDDSAKLFFNARHDNLNVSVTGNLGHIKRNGAFCSVYVVTNVKMNDESNLRITNMSNQEGIVIGTLRNMQNEVVFSGVEMTTISAQATVRLSSEDIENFADANGMANWTNRGVLSMASTIPAGKMEVFLLLRRNGISAAGSGYPLLNMSGGASGNACQ